jgi:hypothetical protein
VKPLLIDVYGGPSSGKSTTSLALTSLLKLYLDQYSGSSMLAEYVSEAAKDDVWESGALMLRNQARLFGEQYRRLHRLAGKVQIIVSDSPLWLCSHYGHPDLYPRDEWAGVIRAHYEDFTVLPILVKRVGRFETAGRVHDEAASTAAHTAIAAIARREYNGSLIELDADVRTPFKVIELLAQRGHIPCKSTLGVLGFWNWYSREIEEAFCG